MSDTCFGLGDHSACLRVFIGNSPEFPEHFSGCEPRPLIQNELSDLISTNSNHWRKVFNIYAKICFELFSHHNVGSWQDYREQHLFKQGEAHSLFFKPWSTGFLTTDSVTIICGKTYAQSLGLMEDARLLHEGFFKTKYLNTFITPYFDHRALSNAKVSWLVNYMRQLEPIKRHLKSGA